VLASIASIVTLWLGSGPVQIGLELGLVKCVVNVILSMCMCLSVCLSVYVVQALGGVLASIASIVTLWLGSGPVQIGFSYFIIALVVTFASLLVFLAVVRLVS